MKSFNDRRRLRRNVNQLSKSVVNNVSLYGQEYKEYIDREYEKAHKHLSDRIGEDTVNRIEEEMDKQLYIAIDKEISSFAKYDESIIK